MKRGEGIIRRKKEDDAVAEIIGTVLVFAIVISVFTAFVAWYIPTEGTVNEQSYQQAAMTAFSDLASKLSSPGIQNGTVIVQSIPLGVTGAAPFQQSYSTQVSSITSASNMNYSLDFSVQINYTQNGGSSHDLNMTVNLTGEGAFQEYGQTNFVSPKSFTIQDGNLITSYGSPSKSTSYGPTPVFISGPAGHETLHTSAISVGGYPVTISQIGSVVMSLAVSNYTSMTYSVGHTYLINGNMSTIDNITVLGYQYFIHTQYFSQWNYTLFSELNNSITTYNPNPAGTVWNSGGFTFAIGSGYIEITSSGPTSLGTLQFNSYVVRIIST